MSSLLEPFRYGFMNEAFLAGMMVAVVCAVLSCYLVLKGWSLMGDAVSHAVLPGIVLAYWVGAPLALGAFGAGLFCAVATGYIKTRSRVKEDTVMGVVFTGLFGLGLVMFSRTTSDLHLDHILFGNILGIDAAQLREIALISGLALALLAVRGRDLKLVCCDPSHAQVIGLSVRNLTFLLLCVLALVIVAALRAVGIILVVAMLITPGATGFLLAKRFARMVLIAVVAAAVCTFAGIYVSFFADASPAACIVLAQSLVFSAAYGKRLWQDRSRTASPDDQKVL
jgi:manganese/iron transport system permease protein